MTDEAYSFRETERERKSLARQSRYKKNGSRTNYVRLPQTYMTEKEIRKMHGKIETISLGKCYSKDEFLKFSDELKKLYIDNLISNYDARRCDIASMLGLSYGGFVHMIHRLYPKSPFKNEGKGAAVSYKWLAFTGQKPADVSEPAPVENAKSAPANTEKVELLEKKDTEKVETPAIKAEYPQLTNLRVHMNGNIVMICAQLIKMLRNDKDYSVSVEVRPHIDDGYDQLPF